MKRALLILFAFLLMAAPAQAAHKIVADLSEDFIAVTQRFEGARLTVFGAIRESSKADIVVVIEGPSAEAQVRKKSRQLGLWINGEAMTLSPVPSFYAVASSAPIEKIMSEKTAAELGLGTANRLAPAEGREGLLSVKREQGLYQDLPGGVVIKESRLFRARIDMPRNVPIGTYEAKIYEFANGRLIASRTAPLKVAQIGIGAYLNDMAHHRPFLYAFMSLAMALLIGGGSAYLLRRMA